MSIAEWKKQEIEKAEKEIGEKCQIERHNSFSAWGAEATRKRVKQVKSPKGGWYVIHTICTNAQREKGIPQYLKVA